MFPFVSLVVRKENRPMPISLDMVQLMPLVLLIDLDFCFVRYGRPSTLPFFFPVDSPTHTVLGSDTTHPLNNYVCFF